MLEKLYEAGLKHLQSAHSQTFQEEWQGHEYAYRVVEPEFGDCKRTLLVLGGALRPLKPWPRLESNLPAGTRVVFLELPGLWDSRAVPSPFTWNLLVGAAVRTLDVLGAATCDVLALSASAPLGYRLVRDHGDRVSRLVMVGALSCVTEEVREVLERMSACLTHDRRLESDRDTRKAFTSAYSDFFLLSRKSTNRAAVTLSATIMRKLFTEVPVEKFRKCAQFYRDLFLANSEQIIPQGDTGGTPMLLIYGELDGVAPPEHAPIIARNSPNCQVAVMKGVGHNLQVESAKDFLDLLTRFLTDVPLNELPYCSLTSNLRQ
ncbi:alpha/beta fold hydrolase [Streptomyces sp. NPDC093093]|uniref:alpha/beta fold hydrolase n=1 Tax=Streptomyces sp. NPDC093093 TaxID=3366025 RepID=UPI00382D62BC